MSNAEQGLPAFGGARGDQGISNDEVDSLVNTQKMASPVIPANPGPARRTRLWQAGRGPGQAPESRKNKHFWTTVFTGVTTLVIFCEIVSLQCSMINAL
jgi:hypothetical protein